MNICLIYSPNWRSYVEVQLYAIFKNHRSPIKVYLISDADGYFETKHLTDHFGQGYEVEFIDAEQLYNERIPSQINVSSRFTKYTLYRLLLPELVKDDRLLYVDTDAIIHNNVKDLYDIDLGGNIIAGASDIHANHYKLRENCGLKMSDAYINAGVILMNLNKIRELGIDKKWLSEVNTKVYRTGDQDIINKTCKGKIKLISNKYNCSISAGLDVPKVDIRIMHWAGAMKPWDNNEVPNTRIWFDWVRDYRAFMRSLVNVNG